MLEKLTHWKRWQYRERLRAGGEGGDRWLDDIIDSMNISLSKLQQAGKDSKASYAEVYGVTKSWTRLNNWTITLRWHQLELSDLIKVRDAWKVSHEQDMENLGKWTIQGQNSTKSIQRVVIQETRFRGCGHQKTARTQDIEFVHREAQHKWSTSKRTAPNIQPSTESQSLWSRWISC